MPSLRSIRPPKSNRSFPAQVSRQSTSGEFKELHHQQIRDVGGRFAGGWGFAWSGLEVVDENISEMADTLRASFERGMEELKDRMVDYMRENAPWEDHPGVHKDARDHLQGIVVKQDDEHFTIFLGHGAEVDYGVWLEVRWGGRFAIIVPTIEYFRSQGIGQNIASLT